MRLVVTGGAGFIGGAAVNHFLSAGDEVLIVDNLTYASNLDGLLCSKIEKIDVCDTDSFTKVLKDFEPDLVFHFAAETHVDNSIKDYRVFTRTNVEGTASVLSACSKTSTKLCHISTDEVYGPAESRSFSEKDPLHPMNPYSVTKAAADLMVQAFKNTYGLDYLIIRPSNNFGPRQNKEKFIPKLINCLNTGEIFPMYGAGDQSREWTYVQDTASYLRKIIERPNLEWNSIYNLSSGISLTNLEAARKIIEIYNRISGENKTPEEILRFSTDRPGHDRKYSIETEKIERLLRFNYTTFEQGIENTVKYLGKKEK